MHVCIFSEKHMTICQHTCTCTDVQSHVPVTAHPFMHMRTVWDRKKAVVISKICLPICTHDVANEHIMYAVSPTYITTGCSTRLNFSGCGMSKSDNMAGLQSLQPESVDIYIVDYNGACAFYVLCLRICHGSLVGPSFAYLTDMSTTAHFRKKSYMYHKIILKHPVWNWPCGKHWYVHVCVREGRVIPGTCIVFLTQNNGSYMYSRCYWSTSPAGLGLTLSDAWRSLKTIRRKWTTSCMLELACPAFCMYMYMCRCI